MEKKTVILLVFGILIVIGFFAVYTLTPRAVLGPSLAGLVGTNGKNSPIGDNIQHCSLNSDAVVNQERLKGASSVKADDDNIRLTLFVDKANVTEFDDQSFYVEVYNKALKPLVFPEVNGDPYTITGYNDTGYVFFRLGGETSFSGVYNEDFLVPPKKPSCFINQGESATFGISTKIGTKDHNSTTIAYAVASIKYLADGKTNSLQTVGDYVQSDINSASQHIDLTSHPSQLLRLVVSPANLPTLKSYFDVAMTLPYPSKLGEEQPLYVIARSAYYDGPYTIEVRLPEGIQKLSGRTQVEGELHPENYVDMYGKPAVNIAEQLATIIRIRPEAAGNYAIQATIYSVFNGTRVGNTDTIWLSVPDNDTSSVVSREKLPNSVKPSAKAGASGSSEIIQDKNPIPNIRIAANSSYHNPIATDFSWPDGIDWMLQKPRSVFATVGPYLPAIEDRASTVGKNNTPVKLNNNSIDAAYLTINNGSTIRLSIENTELPPSLLIVELYNREDIIGEYRNKNISNLYSPCIIYTPTSINRAANPYEQCPIESSVVIKNDTVGFASHKQPTQAEKQNYTYDLNIYTKKPGQYVMDVYAQWASDKEIRFNENYRTVNSQFRLQVIEGSQH